MDLNEVRYRIDETDEQIAKLFAKRMRLSEEVAACKKESGKAVGDGLREREVLEHVKAVIGEPYSKYSGPVYNAIMAASRAYQYELNPTRTEFTENIGRAIEAAPQTFPRSATVACQGIAGANSETAARKMIQDPTIMYLKNFEAVFKAVESGMCRYGVLPIENSNYGSIGAIYDMMRDHHAYIVRAVKLSIKHCLMAKKGVRLEDIKEVYSKEEALGQCRVFLNEHDGMAQTPVDNTAVAARMVAESDRTDLAAIASYDCAELYGLSIIADGIQSANDNYTRFICISREMELYPGDNKVSLVLQTPHKPMGLYNTIGKISNLGVNICKLESRPAPESDYTFMFYFDLDASIRTPAVQQVLSDLEATPEYFNFLGAYQEL